MKRYLFFSLLLLPLYVFSQIRIDISPNLVKDTSKKSYWHLDGRRLDLHEFPVNITQIRNCMDTIVFVHERYGKLVADTAFVIFPKNAKLLLVPDNDGSFDIIEKGSVKRNKNKAKFCVQITSSDTIICCYSSETALVGQLFTASGSSGWLKPFTTPYSSNMINVIIFRAKNMNYHALEKDDSLFFGDKNCTIVGWDSDQLSQLSKIASFKLRLFDNNRIIIKYDNDTQHVTCQF